MFIFNQSISADVMVNQFDPLEENMLKRMEISNNDERLQATKTDRIEVSLRVNFEDKFLRWRLTANGDVPFRQSFCHWIVREKNLKMMEPEDFV